MYWIVVRIWEGFPPGPALTDRDTAFQPSHYEHLSSLSCWVATTGLTNAAETLWLCSGR